MIDLALPYPPTANHYWTRRKGHHGLAITSRGVAFRQEVAALVALAEWPTVADRRCIVLVDAWLPDNRARDMDNLLKALLDALQKAEVFENDKQVVPVGPIPRGICPGAGRCRVRITPFVDRFVGHIDATWEALTEHMGAATHDP